MFVFRIFIVLTFQTSSFRLFYGINFFSLLFVPVVGRSTVGHAVTNRQGATRLLWQRVLTRVRACVRMPVILCSPGSLCPSVLHMLYWRRLGSALPVARGQAICHSQTLVLASHTHLCSLRPPAPPPARPSVVSHCEPIELGA